MSEITDLQSKLDAELADAKSRAEKVRKEWEEYDHELQGRMKKFEAAMERLRPVWTPRLELLRDRFAKFSTATPEIKPFARSITFSFSSKQVVELKFSADSDKDVRNLVLEYDLLILPVVVKYERHAALEVPIDKVDEQAVGRWFDDRIMDFVKTYIALQGDDFVEKNL